jgi:hypothetical protein
MQVVGTPIDTSTTDGAMEALAQSLGMPSGNLDIGLDFPIKGFADFVLKASQELAGGKLDEVRTQKRIEQLSTAARGVQMLLEARDLMRAVKYSAEQLSPPAPVFDEAPAPLPRRQS